MTLEDKLKEIIKRLDKIDYNMKNIDVRISNIDKKLDNLSFRLDSLELEFETKCEEIDKLKISKAEAASIEELKERIVFLETFKLNYENTKVMQESYDKRLNILVHGVKEDSDNVWEKRDKTIEKFEQFLQNGLKITDPNDVEYVDIHRLPQHPVKRNAKTVHRPIVVKILTMSDKNEIFKNAKNLKDYNNQLKEDNSNNPTVYITEHLPHKFQQQWKLLLPQFKEAKKKKQKAVWKALNGNSTLFIDDKQVDLIETDEKFDNSKRS